MPWNTVNHGSTSRVGRPAISSNGKANRQEVLRGRRHLTRIPPKTAANFLLAPPAAATPLNPATPFVFQHLSLPTKFSFHLPSVLPEHVPRAGLPTPRPGLSGSSLAPGNVNEGLNAPASAAKAVPSGEIPAAGLASDLQKKNADGLAFERSLRDTKLTKLTKLTAAAKARAPEFLKEFNAMRKRWRDRRDYLRQGTLALQADQRLVQLDALATLKATPVRDPVFFEKVGPHGSLSTYWVPIERQERPIEGNKSTKVASGPVAPQAMLPEQTSSSLPASAPVLASSAIAGGQQPEAGVGMGTDGARRDSGTSSDSGGDTKMKTEDVLFQPQSPPDWLEDGLHSLSESGLADSTTLSPTNAPAANTEGQPTTENSPDQQSSSAPPTVEQFVYTKEILEKMQAAAQADRAAQAATPLVQGESAPVDDDGKGDSGRGVDATGFKPVERARLRMSRSERTERSLRFISEQPRPVSVISDTDSDGQQKAGAGMRTVGVGDRRREVSEKKQLRRTTDLSWLKRFAPEPEAHATAALTETVLADNATPSPAKKQAPPKPFPRRISLPINAPAPASGATAGTVKPLPQAKTPQANGGWQPKDGGGWERTPRGPKAPPIGPVDLTSNLRQGTRIADMLAQQYALQPRIEHPAENARTESTDASIEEVHLLSVKDRIKFWDKR